MTDITELAQRLKLEVHRAVSNFNPQMNIKTRDLKELVGALEKAQKSNAFLKGQLSELANFNPDWDKLEASYESWREIAAELLEAKERIAELEMQLAQPCEHSMFWDASGVKRCSKCDRAEPESRTVKLPDDEDGQAYGFGKWSNGKLPATAGTMTIAYCEDAWRAAFEVFASAAGIKVEAE